MPVRKIAAHSREFWVLFAPFASATLLAERLPIESGGLSIPGWGNAIKKAKVRHPDLAWLTLRCGQRPPVVAEGEWPVPVYEDEVSDTGRLKSGPAPAQEAPPNSYKETVEILADGSYKSDKLLKMSANESKDRLYLLQAHGFDPNEWEIVTAKNNIWNVFSKSDDPDNPHNVSTLYSSKITVRPKTTGFDIEAVLEAVRAIEPVKTRKVTQGESLLEIGNTDMHFGNSTLGWYMSALELTVNTLNIRRWACVVIPIGSDLFHCDNFKNTTSNGTPQSSVSWPEAWADAFMYYSTVIDAALRRSVRVCCYYVIGNHDESMSWAFCQMLAAKYPQVEFDLEIAERKVHTFGRVAIGMTHGDGRTRKDLDRVFMAEFPEFANAFIKEVHAGHVHHEVTVDEYGVVVRFLPTAARTDKWHREEGYVGACKRFQLFEYTEHALEYIRYV